MDVVFLFTAEIFLFNSSFQAGRCLLTENIRLPWTFVECSFRYFYVAFTIELLYQSISNILYLTLRRTDSLNRHNIIKQYGNQKTHVIKFDNIIILTILRVIFVEFTDWIPFGVSFLRKIIASLKHFTIRTKIISADSFILFCVISIFNLRNLLRVYLLPSFIIPNNSLIFPRSSHDFFAKRNGHQITSDSPCTTFPSQLYAYIVALKLHLDRWTFSMIKDFVDQQ